MRSHANYVALFLQGRHHVLQTWFGEISRPASSAARALPVQQHKDKTSAKRGLHQDY